MTSVPELSFSHMGIYVTDPARMEDFYTRVLGFAVTDRGKLETPRGAVDLVFLSRDARDHHQIVLASGRPAGGGFNPINQISFRVADLAGLREMHQRVEKRACASLSRLARQRALGLLSRSRGNRIELFIDTPWYVEQPVRVPPDLSLPDAELWAWVERDARGRPGFKPVEQWRAEFRV